MLGNPAIIFFLLGVASLGTSFLLEDTQLSLYMSKDPDVKFRRFIILSKHVAKYTGFVFLITAALCFSYRQIFS